MPQKQKEVRDFARKFDLEIVGTVDTRGTENKLQAVMNLCFPG